MARQRQAPTMGATAGVLVVLAGVVAGSGPLFDNSFLTHLATGRMWWDGLGLPHEDPYTFTAAGERWVVQSWLASLAYGGVERVAGLEGLRILTAALTGVLAALTWLLTKPARTLTPRVVLALAMLVVAFDRWTERPLLFGLVGIALVLLALGDRLDPRWLVPAMWVWVNTHGSWPLGFVLIGLVLVGRLLDRHPFGPGRAVLAWSLLGTALGAVNPYGIRILTFPVELLGRTEAISGMREWRRAAFDEPTTWAVVVLGLLAAFALRRRWRWEHALPAAAFLAAGLYSSRNLLPAAFVLVAAAAPGLEGLGTIDGERRHERFRLLWAASAAVLALVLAGAVTGDAFDDEPFPVAAERFLREEGIDPRTHRVAARDFVGNWLEARYGPTGMVYMDDRAEVLPVEVIEGHAVLLSGGAEWEQVLDGIAPDAVLWERDSDLARYLAEDSSWAIVYEDADWVVALPQR